MATNGLVLLYEAAVFLEKNSKTLTQRQSNRSKVTQNRGPRTSASAAAVRPSVHVRSHQPAANLIRTLPASSLVRKDAVGIFQGPQRFQVINLPTATHAIRRTTGSASRSSHNELEKNRRAHLRRRLDSLRDCLPISKGDAYRLTMLNVLNKAVDYIKTMELETMDKKEKLEQLRSQKKNYLATRCFLHKKLKAYKRKVEARLHAQKSSSVKDEDATMMPAPSQAPAVPLTALEESLLRSRNASEVSNTSVGSVETELLQVPSSTSDTAATVPGRLDGCGSPDSGYASPNSCSLPQPLAT